MYYRLAAHVLGANHTRAYYRLAAHVLGANHTRITDGVGEKHYLHLNTNNDSRGIRT